MARGAVAVTTAVACNLTRLQAFWVVASSLLASADHLSVRAGEATWLPRRPRHKRQQRKRCATP